MFKTEKSLALKMTRNFLSTKNDPYLVYLSCPIVIIIAQI